MENISPALLEWFYKNRRSLPFREDPTPYHVWLSEVMLQQTRVSAVLPYYYRFLEALPDIPALAACGEEKLHKLWEGLGYYSRVRNLQKAAKLVCAQYGGQLPADYAALLALPGIGEYTAGAIASISFGLPVPAVDGNVLRVFSRLYNDPGVITEPAVKKAFTARVMEHQPPEKAGDYNQALMELGALVCVPNGAPLCGQCPLAEVCRARAAGTTAAAAPKGKAEAPQDCAGNAGTGGKPGGLSGTAAAGKRAACRAVAAGIVGGRASFAGRGAGAAGGIGAGHRHGSSRRPARRKAHLYPHRVAHVRRAAARSGAECPGGLCLGKPGAAAHHLRPARGVPGI